VTGLRVVCVLASAPAGRVRTVGEVPEPVVLGAALLVGTLAWLVGMWLLGRGLYRLWQRVGGRVGWLLDLVFPDSPLVKFATGLTLFILLVVVIVGALPALVGDLEGSDDGPASVADELSDRGLDSDWEDIVDGDAVGGTAVCRGQQVDGPDRDGDGLPDTWERAGETPEGSALSGSDPGRKDLYVQLDHGSNVESLTDREREQLRSAWARMPVENPDGSTGIDLHLVDGGPRGGDIGGTVVVSDQDSFPRYYTADRLGDRLCVYHQVVYGDTELGERVGLGSVPGYATAVEGRQPPYDGNVSFRVAVTTHELLHNVAGRVGGRPHTSGGWLAGTLGDEHLSRSTARELNETGLFGPAH
jgi:hypothetical protein